MSIIHDALGGTLSAVSKTAQINDDHIELEMRKVRDELMRAQILARDDKGEGAPCKTCRKAVWVGIFFDGTGNNRDLDFPIQKHTNVVALSHAHKFDPENGSTVFYYEGIGTPFEFSEHYEEHRYRDPAVGDITVPVRGYKETTSRARQAVGLGTDERLDKALFELVRYLERQNRKTGITEINLSVYGFSRGAAQARFFCNWLSKAPNVQQLDYDRLTYRNIPLRVRFLGLFDSVESLGNAADNLNPQLYPSRVPAYVECCTHLTAALELRQSFPLTPIHDHAGAPATVKDLTRVQEVYPGVHSNVGGGYKDGEQFRSHHLARVALMRMHDRARAAGVPLLSVEEMQANKPQWAKTYQYSFDPAPIRQAETAMAQFLAHAKPKSNSLRDITNAYTELYRQWITDGLYDEFVQNTLAAHRDQPPPIPYNATPATKADCLARFKENIKALERARFFIEIGAPLSARVTPSQMPVRTHRAVKTPPEVQAFIERYVIDSLVGFGTGTLAVMADLHNPDYNINRLFFDPIKQTLLRD